jgi:fibronectin type 3 domain-containing protein
MEAGRLVGISIRWKASPLAKIVAYEVYRRTENGTFRRLKRVKDNAFIDKTSRDATTQYAVAAIDIYGNSSRLSAPISARQDPSSTR